MKKLKANTLYMLDVPENCKEDEAEYKKTLGIDKHNNSVLCLGEITNMRGHYIFVSTHGKIVWGYHGNMFRLPTDNEL